ncbi:hypothetical protein JO861_24190 [Rhodococcus hoagii]|uniref:hypothetical protein n=1 Tax=Rhodococcus hoagii TaxID=43767 RepID=UPI001962E588|nr:hypothetical protein [Prescottella equi]MBM9839655.1 hypothetical protein [Prescottella equi]
MTELRESADSDPPPKGGSCMRVKASAVILQAANFVDIGVEMATASGCESAAWVNYTKAAALLLRLIAGLVIRG